MAAPGRNAYEVADHYDAVYFQDLSSRYLRRTRFARRRLRNVLSLLPPLAGLRVLDLGCGMGTFALETAAAGARAVGVDLAPAALVAAQRVARKTAARRAQFVRADGVSLPFPPGVFDLLITADLTEHLDDDTLERLLREARRVLRPGASMILYTPSATHLFERLRASAVLRQDPSHIGVRSAEQLRSALEAAGFRIVRTEFLPSHLLGWNLLERLFARRFPLLRRRVGIVAQV